MSSKSNDRWDRPSPPVIRIQSDRIGSALGGAERSIREVVGQVSGLASRWTDPRARLQRRRRRARKASVRLGGASAGSVVGTTGLALASAPDWTLFMGGGTAVLLAIPAAAAYRRYRELRARPLPPAAPVRRVLPDSRSAAYRPMARLNAAETSLHQLLLVLGRSGAVSDEEIEEATNAGLMTADALASAARDVVAMELARWTAHGAREHLESAIIATVARLENGVGGYEELVSAAAKTASAAASGSTSVDLQRTELGEATDRLEALAVAIGEVAAIRRRHQ